METSIDAKRRTRRPRAEREAEILSVARSVFAEKGYAGAAVSEIAARAGVVEGTVYTYFESKRALLIAVMKSFYTELIADTESGLRAVRGPENRLRFIIRRHLETFTADMGICRVIIREARPDTALYDEAILEQNRRYTGLALTILEEGVASGAFRRAIVPSVIRDLLYGGIEHAVWRYVFGGGDLDLDELADQLADAVLGGISAPQADQGDAMTRLENVVARLEEGVDAQLGSRTGESGRDTKHD